MKLEPKSQERGYVLPTYEVNGRKYLDWEKLPGVEKTSSGQLVGYNTLVTLSALLDGF
jgi:hypothetical protein